MVPVSQQQGDQVSNIPVEDFARGRAGVLVYSDCNGGKCLSPRGDSRSWLRVVQPKKHEQEKKPSETLMSSSNG